MIEVLVVLSALVGGLCLLFAAMAGLADYVLPALEAKPWRANRRPAATRRAR
jgi:hypothetical protein